VTRPTRGYEEAGQPRAALPSQLPRAGSHATGHRGTTTCIRTPRAAWLLTCGPACASWPVSRRKAAGCACLSSRLDKRRWGQPWSGQDCPKVHPPAARTLHGVGWVAGAWSRPRSQQAHCFRCAGARAHFLRRRRHRRQISGL